MFHNSSLKSPLKVIKTGLFVVMERTSIFKITRFFFLTLLCGGLFFVAGGTLGIVVGAFLFLFFVDSFPALLLFFLGGIIAYPLGVLGSIFIFRFFFNEPFPFLPTLLVSVSGALFVLFLFDLFNLFAFPIIFLIFYTLLPTSLSTTFRYASGDSIIEQIRGLVSEK